MDAIRQMPWAGGASASNVSAAAPWGIEGPAVSATVFHLVTRGRCWLHVPGAEPLLLDTGDFALVANGSRHSLSSERQKHVALQGDQINGSAVEIAGDGPRTQFLCAGYRSKLASPSAPALPPVLHLTAEKLAAQADLAATLHVLERETTAGLAGAEVVIDRLVDVVTVHALRSWLPAEQAGDQAIAAAVRALDRELHRAWTLDSLAARVGLSRATLTRRFTAAMGEPPLRYLRRRRLEAAARRLREGEEPLAAIARQLGYASEFALSRAFSRDYGTAPSHYRARERQTPGEH